MKDESAGRWYAVFALCMMVALLLWSDSGRAAATAEQSPTLLQALKEKSSIITSFSSTFVQTKELSMFSRPVVFRGVLTVIRPDRLRWEFTEPVASVLIFNGNSGMRCESDGQVTTFDLQDDPVMRMVAEQLWLWLGGDYDRLGKEYELAVIDNHRLRVRPRTPQTGEYIVEVLLLLDPENLQPQQVIIREAGGDTTRIAFSSYRLNEPVDERVFTSCTADG